MLATHLETIFHQSFEAEMFVTHDWLSQRMPKLKPTYLMRYSPTFNRMPTLVCAVTPNESRAV
jgi:hypothetical protein